MKKIVYGPTGYGKSYNVIAPYLKRMLVTYVTTNGVDRELEHMPPLNKKQKNRISKNSVDLSRIPWTCRHDFVVGELTSMLEKFPFVWNPFHTVVFSGPSSELENEVFVKRIESWPCNVVVEYMTPGLLPGELEHILHSKKWTKVPVLSPLYDKEVT